MTIPEAAARLNLSASTLRWQIANGKLKARRMGKSGPWFVSEEEVARYAAEHRRNGTGDLSETPPIIA